MRDKLVMYLNSRISDTLDTTKTSTPEDTQWLNRLTQELEWAKQVHLGIYTPDCVMSSGGTGL